nr:GNAT family protein [uncultured Cohaesibacter sp.]
MLSLIPSTSEHFSHLVGWFPDERVLAQWGGTGLGPVLSPLKIQEMLDEEKKIPPSRLCRTAIDDEGKQIGHVQIALDWINGVGRLARVVVAPEMRGKGYAVPMIKSAVSILFSIDEIERAELNVYTWNVAAIRTYEKVGFVKEGVRRSSARVGTERWDTEVMGLLRDEWTMLR